MSLLTHCVLSCKLNGSSLSTWHRAWGADRELEFNSCWPPSWLDPLVSGATHTNIHGNLHSHPCHCSWGRTYRWRPMGETYPEGESEVQLFITSGEGWMGRWNSTCEMIWRNTQGQEPAEMCSCILNTRKHWTVFGPLLHIPPQKWSESLGIWDNAGTHGHFLTWNQRSSCLKEDLQEGLHQNQAELLKLGHWSREQRQ